MLVLELPLDCKEADARPNALVGGGEGGKRGDLALEMFAGSGSSSENGRLADGRLAIFASKIFPFFRAASDSEG